MPEVLGVCELLANKYIANISYPSYSTDLKL